MGENQFANLANCNSKKTQEVKNKSMTKALDTLSELLGIEFGSLTIHFHQGKWSPKIQIQRNVIQDLGK